MAITPQPGYIVDPNNPNGVIRDPNATVSFGNMSLGATNTQPVAQSPVSPSPLPPTPAAPTAPTPSPYQPSPVQPQGTGLTMPANGSVVDLLNMAGQDSSFAARQQLAQQYGIQGYTGTASQNQELSKKYLDAYNANKGSATPQTGAQASSALDSYFQQQQPVDTPQDPTRAFMDVFAGMNPIEANIFQQLSGLLS